MGLTVVIGDVVWGGIGTLSIGLLLVIIAIKLTVEMQSLLIGKSATARRRRHNYRSCAPALT